MQKIGQNIVLHLKELNDSRRTFCHETHTCTEISSGKFLYRKSTDAVSVCMNCGSRNSLTHPPQVKHFRH
jgi:hypothetical protein